MSLKQSLCPHRTLIKSIYFSELECGSKEYCNDCQLVVRETTSESSDMQVILVYQSKLANPTVFGPFFSKEQVDEFCHRSLEHTEYLDIERVRILPVSIPKEVWDQ